MGDSRRVPGKVTGEVPDGVWGGVLVRMLVGDQGKVLG